MFFRKTTASRSQNPGAPAQDRRRAPRIETAILSCELGQVIDISRKGVKISSGQSPPRLSTGAQVGLQLSSPTDDLEIAARVVRIRKSAAGRYEIALDFAPMTDLQADAIEALARTGSTRAALNSDAARRARLVAAMKLSDHYATLGIKAGATVEQVQQAFRALARTCHPDINKDPAAHRRFIEINEAHTVLCDPAQREEYDRMYALRRAA